MNLVVPVSRAAASLNPRLHPSRFDNPQDYLGSAVWVIAKLQRKMKEVIMGRVLLASLTPTSLAATAFVATSLVAAHAAELPVKAPPAPTYYNWTGPYLGVNLGGSWGNQSGELVDEAGLGIFGFTDHPDGVIGGGQIGYNWQFPGWGWGNGFVLGIEADIQGSSERTSDGFGFLIPPEVGGSFEDKLEWFGTVRGRAGIAFDRVLPYVTGGWAIGDRKLAGTLFGPTVGEETLFSAHSNMNEGWTVGGGIEWAFWDHWTAKFEYLYIDFGNQNNNTLIGPPDAPITPFTLTTNHFIENIARAGVNYKF
jgi:outer membrane immunogenic protein